MKRTLRYFDTAMDNMANGLCLWSPEHRLMLANRRLIELLGLPARDIVPGMTYRAFVEARHATGSYGARNLEQVYQERLEFIARKQPTSNVEVTLAGHAIRSLHRPTADGGWVVTYEDVTERREVEARLAFLAAHDGLTGLDNRQVYHDRLGAVVAAGQPVAVLSVDIDYFKQVNETLGHLFGDELLQAVARRLRQVVGEDDTVARLGGDEFGVLLAGDLRPDEVEAVAARVVETLTRPFEIAGRTLAIGVSIGIARHDPGGFDAATLLKQADLALYASKAGGRGTYTLFDPEQAAHSGSRTLFEQDLRHSLAAGELSLVYQPQVDMRSGLVSCFEALLRWYHPERGMVSPTQFIPVAEELRLIADIGEWALRRACGDAAQWPSDVRVAVNLSALQFETGGLLQMVQAALDESGLEPARLELEITESVLIKNTEQVGVTLRALRDIGVRIALDDFGTGYSSLSYLHSFPFDKIKIDRSFIRNLGVHPESAAIVRAVTGLAANLGMRTVAEGVETSHQLEQVRANGCNEVQGFLFSKPRPALDVADMLAEVSDYVPEPDVPNRFALPPVA